jgi:hypothetical protein
MASRRQRLAAACAVLLWRLGGEVWALRLPLGEALTKS